jgi:NADH dehydrogenase (ubiquinone) 1 beta subcomplex subunit 8
LIQQRTFLPESMVGKSKIDEKYPDSDYPTLTPEEDPEMVCRAGQRGARTG